jgi:hypothetical protein
MSQRLSLRLCPALCTRARSFSLPLGRSRFYRAPVLIIRALHAYLLIWPAESSARLYRGLFPFPLMLLSGGRPLVRARARARVRSAVRAYIIRSIRYLMAVSVSDMYLRLRSSPPC